MKISLILLLFCFLIAYASEDTQFFGEKLVKKIHEPSFILKKYDMIKRDMEVSDNFFKRLVSNSKADVKQAVSAVKKWESDSCAVGWFSSAESTAKQWVSKAEGCLKHLFFEFESSLKQLSSIHCSTGVLTNALVNAVTLVEGAETCKLVLIADAIDGLVNWAASDVEKCVTSKPVKCLVQWVANGVTDVAGWMQKSEKVFELLIANVQQDLSKNQEKDPKKWTVHMKSDYKKWFAETKNDHLDFILSAVEDASTLTHEAEKCLHVDNCVANWISTAFNDIFKLAMSVDDIAMKLLFNAFKDAENWALSVEKCSKSKDVISAIDTNTRDLAKLIEQDVMHLLKDLEKDFANHGMTMISTIGKWAELGAKCTGVYKWAANTANKVGSVFSNLEKDTKTFYAMEKKKVASKLSMLTNDPMTELEEDNGKCSGASCQCQCLMNATPIKIWKF